MHLSVYCVIFDFAQRQYITVKPACDRNHRSVLLFYEAPLTCGSFYVFYPTTGGRPAASKTLSTSKNSSFNVSR